MCLPSSNHDEKATNSCFAHVVEDQNHRKCRTGILIRRCSPAFIGISKSFYKSAVSMGKSEYDICLTEKIIQYFEI